MIKKSFTKIFTVNDRLNIQIWYVEKKKIVKFSLNYQSYIKGGYRDIYRVDECHNILHEHKFWRGEERIPIEEEGLSKKEIMNKYIDKICLEYDKYKKYYKERSEKGFEDEKEK